MQTAKHSPDTTYLLTQLQRTKIAAIQELRRAFKIYGFDVSHYDDNQVGDSILRAADVGVGSSRQLFGCAFQRLQGARPARNIAR